MILGITILVLIGIYILLNKSKNITVNFVAANDYVCRRMGNTIAAVFVPIGCLCQRISFSVFAVVSACCVPVSHSDVLTRSAFRAVKNSAFPSLAQS